MKKSTFALPLLTIATIYTATIETSFANIPAFQQSVAVQQAKPVADTLFNKYYDATGGRKLWSEVKTYTAAQKYASSVNYDVVLNADVAANSLHKSRIAMKREFVYVSKPNEGWLKIPIGGTDKAAKYQVNSLNATEKSGLVKEMYNTLVPFFDYKKRGLIANYVGSETLDGKKVEQVELQDKGIVYNLYFDAQTNLLVQVKEKSGGVEYLRKYANYVKSDSGISYPSVITETNSKDKKVTTITTSKFIINPTLGTNLFQK